MIGPKKKRNRAAQDATLINIRSLRKALKKLEGRMESLEAFLHVFGLKCPGCRVRWRLGAPKLRSNKGK